MAEPPSRRTVVPVVVSLILLVAAVVVFADPFGEDDPQKRTSDAAPSFDDGAGDEDAADGGNGSSGPPDDETPTGSDPSITLEPVAEIGPVSAMVDPPGDGPVLLSSLDGLVREVDLDTGEAEIVLDLSENVTFEGERGLLGMAADPDFERLYVNYTDTSGDTDVRSWPLVDGRPDGGPDDGLLHLEIGQPYSNHNGGHLVFGPDGLLWIGTGDGGSSGDPLEAAQDPSVLLGKMLRVAPDPEGGVLAPDSNPDWDGRPEVWGIGLRNPWRYSFDRATGELWVADVGQNEVEEVTVVSRDEPMPNFGWDDVEGDQPFEGSPDPAFLDPVVTYGHDDGACSITGGFVYRGEQVESLQGWYLFGDFCGGWIRAVPADEPTSEPVELVSDAGGAITFLEDEDGELLFATQTGLFRVVAG